ncbi:hypothetical protein UFOVP435_58 [uncultured Caudovirales phage]|uniref:Uncharacterized protein n=1 Tax=uncultured Caudovirales phage TaxID=2100421 RepID=A0A6J5M8T3_9CAUD|nr:hypothetical protein UFOVP435_58 [uncultured Caudovirales phage]
MARGSTIIATTFFMDVSGFEGDYRYQPGHTKKAIYSIGDVYFCVSKTKPKDEVGQPWQLAADQAVAERHNTKLWFSKMSEV